MYNFFVPFVFLIFHIVLLWLYHYLTNFSIFYKYAGVLLPCKDFIYVVVKQKNSENYREVIFMVDGETVCEWCG